jgi:predicted transcriptional regulator
LAQIFHDNSCLSKNRPLVCSAETPELISLQKWLDDALQKGEFCMSDSPALTPQETALVQILLDHGSASASQLATRMSQSDPVNHADILDSLQSLRAKNAVSRHQYGRRIIYRAQINRQTAPMHPLGRLLNDGMAGNDNALGALVFRDCDLDPEDLAALRAERAEKARRHR